MELEYRRPALGDRAAFADWIAEWTSDPYRAYRGIFACAWTDFEAFVALCERLRAEGWPPTMGGPLEVWWAFAGELLVGEYKLFAVDRERDNDIGYLVRPSCRRRGIATALLRRGLDTLAARGAAEARITCDDTNLASAAVIERAGGIRLADKLGADGHRTRRYRISLRPQDIS